MGIIGRFTDIMSANVNALLQKAEGENADKLLKKYIQDAKENLGQVKSETAAVIAEEMAAGRKLNELDELYKKYEGYAMSAVKSGNDEDAKKFLTYNMELQGKREDLSKAYESAKQNSEKMRQMTSKLTEELGEAESKLNELNQKLTIAKQQENVNKLNEKFGSNPLGNFDNMFDAVQKRIDKAEAESALNNDINSKTQDIEDLAKKYETSTGKPQQLSVEEQLARMKSEI